MSAPHPRCSNCLLPSAVPGADIDETGTCRSCREYQPIDDGQATSARREREEDLERALEDCRGGAEYDVVVCLSGGKDSIWLLHKLVAERGLRVLAFTTDINIPDIAWKNIRRTVSKLAVDHLVYRPDEGFYRRVFRYLLTHQEQRGAVYTVSYVYAPLFEGDALKVATEKGIPLVLAGYSPGQPEPERMLYEFSRQLIEHTDWTPPHLRECGEFSEQELARFWNPARDATRSTPARYLAPLHAWPYDQEAIMRDVVRLGLVANSRYASPIFSNYPINWLLMYSDLLHFGYNPYVPEFSTLIREGKASRTYWKVMAPIVDGMVRNKILLGREVKRSMDWLQLADEDLKITQPLGAYDSADYCPMTALTCSVTDRSATAPAAASDRAETITDWLEALATCFPDRRVFFERPSAESRNWEGSTYAEVLERIRQYASALAALGLSAGDVVAIALPTSLAWECLDKAALALGAAVIGIEPHAPATYRHHILRTVRPRVLVVDSSQQLQRYPSEIFTGMKFAIVGGHGSPVHMDGLTVHPWTALSEHPGRNVPAAAHDAGAAAAIVFTSGTTGNAKGVAFSHSQLLFAARAIVERLDPRAPEGRTLCWLPMGNLFQRMINLCALERGMAIYYHADPRTMMESVRSVRPTVLIGVPKVYQLVYRGFRERLAGLPLGIGRWVMDSLEAPSPDAESADGPLARPLAARIAGVLLRSFLGGRIEFMVSGSAPCPVATSRFFHRLGIPLLEAYGVSENATPIAINAPGASRIGSVGKPLVGNEVKISEDGEVLVRGPGLCTGYLGTPGKRLITDGDGFYRTGDEGSIDADGYLWLSGRRADVVKLASGRRINLTDVERSLWTLDPVDQAIAFAHGRDYVTCALVLTPPHGEAAVPPARIAALTEGIHRAQAEWPRHARVRGVLIVSAPFSMEREEITPNLKLRRAIIEKHHAARLADLDERIRASAAAGGDAIVWMHE